jgi:hypothetical protein
MQTRHAALPEWGDDVDEYENMEDVGYRRRVVSFDALHSLSRCPSSSGQLGALLRCVCMCRIMTTLHMICVGVCFSLCECVCCGIWV